MRRLIRSLLTRQNRRAHLFGCLAVLGVFVVENPHCGSSPFDHGQLAVHYLEKGQYDRALKVGRRALREAPSRVENYLIVANALLGKDQLEEAVLTLSDAALANPKADRLYAAIREICSEKDKERYALAQQTYAGLLEKQPDNLRARAGLGWALAQLGQTEEAIDILEEVAQTDTSDAAFAHIQLSRLYSEKEELPLAIAALERGLERVPNDPKLHYELGRTYAKNGQIEQAESQFNQVLTLEQGKIDPRLGISRRLDWVYRIAHLYSDLGLFARSVPYYEILLQETEPSPAILNNLAWAYAQENLKLDLALDLALGAVKREPHSPVYLDTYAEIYFRLGSPRRAIALINRALDAEPENGQHREYLLEQLQRFNRARRL